jgi:F-type H+-transporting ATPase subunit a
MRITPDQLIFWQYGFVKLNLTIVTTWGIMILMTAFSYFITRNLAVSSSIGRFQNLLEIIVEKTRNLLEETGLEKPLVYIDFIGTLFLFIAISNLLTILPAYEAPTASLSTTAALALCVFIAVPLYGIVNKGFLGYLKNYISPTPFMLPFNIISEVSRTLALAIRLFGNAMSGTMIVAILIGVAPLFFPIFMRLIGLISGLVQAYIFAVLAVVYLAAGTRTEKLSNQGEENG